MPPGDDGRGPARSNERPPPPSPRQGDGTSRDPGPPNHGATASAVVAGDTCPRGMYATSRRFAASAAARANQRGGASRPTRRREPTNAAACAAALIARRRRAPGGKVSGRHGSTVYLCTRESVDQVGRLVPLHPEGRGPPEADKGRYVSPPCGSVARRSLACPIRCPIRRAVTRPGRLARPYWPHCSKRKSASPSHRAAPASAAPAASGHDTWAQMRPGAIAGLTMTGNPW